MTQSAITPSDRGMPTFIRQATSADSHILARLRYDFRSALNSPNGSPNRPPTEDAGPFIARCEAWMAPRLKEGGDWWAWVAVCDVEIVGNVWLHRIEKLPNPVDEPEAHGYITNMYVAESHRGAGTGSMLLAAALWKAAKLALDEVVLWPTPRSRTLYERHGFAVNNGVLSVSRP